MTTLEEHIRRCYSHDLPDAKNIDSAEEALLVYRSGYLEGLKDGQHISGEVTEQRTENLAQLNFDRGYVQGLSYAAFGASHVGMPEGMDKFPDYVSRLHAANIMRDKISAWISHAARLAKAPL